VLAAVQTRISVGEKSSRWREPLAKGRTAGFGVTEKLRPEATENLRSELFLSSDSENLIQKRRNRDRDSLRSILYGGMKDRGPGPTREGRRRALERSG
jgi:hypothetical protein